MGRCNNRRTQQRAQELQNTPARARFSKHNPQKNKKKKKAGNNNDTTAAANNSSTNNSNNDRRQQNKKNVVNRIANRVVGQQQQSGGSTAAAAAAAASSAASTANPFRGVDLSKLDTIRLSEESISLAYRILTDLNIVERGEQQQQQQSSATVDDVGGSGAATRSADFEEDDEAVLLQGQQPSAAAAEEDGRPTTRNKKPLSSYSEYDDDVQEENGDAGYFDGHHRPVLEEHYSAEWEGTRDADDAAATSTTATGGRIPRQEEAAPPPSTNKHLDDPVFAYLTEHWSFDASTASRACVALGTWQGSGVTTADNNKGGGGEEQDNGNSHQQQDWRRRVGLALDWLSLHLEESDLKAGLKPRGRQQSSSSMSSYNNYYNRPTVKTVAVAHPSISIPPKLTEDSTFLHQARLEERAVAYVALGFTFPDTMQILERQQEQQGPAAAEKDDDAPNNVLEREGDEEMLIQLLSSLEEEILHSERECEVASERDTSTGKLDDEERDRIREERELEKEALLAIYEQAFTVVWEQGNENNSNNNSTRSTERWDRYKMSITLEEDDNSNSSEEEAELHVFLRPCYPITHRPPLFLFYHPHYPAPLLRRINAELIRHVHSHQTTIGGPCVFEAVTFLNENLAVIREDFQRELRAQEFEAEQFRMRKEAGHKVIDTQEECDSSGMGRRQRAKLKGLERAFDRDQQLEKEEQERRMRQEERLQRIQQEDKSVRHQMASTALEKRERELHETGMRRAYRSAMLNSLNRNESAEEARVAADRAKREYRRGHGLLDESCEGGESGETSGDEVDSTTGEEDADGIAKHQATPTTLAFMERLRTVYNKAAQQKGKFHLGEATAKDERSNNVEERPCPVAVPVGDLADIIEDVVTVQKEQPWLVSADARVPLIEGDIEVPGAESVDQNEEQKKISNQLKRELERRYDSTKSSKPLRKIFEQRQGLPAYQMREEIVATIARNQITVIAGDTGCGKTTQVPQLVLDDIIQRNVGASANIIITQPRRISAIGVSERVAAERGEKVGQTCGYSIKLEKKMSKKTRLLLCTTGVLLRRLQCDPDLAAVSHVFVDEIHERDLNTDFLLIILKDLLIRRKSLKLVLMSATLNAEAFASYFDGSVIVNIPGRTHPVEEFRLEDVLKVTGYEVQEDSDYAAKQNLRRWSKTALRKRYYGKYDSGVINSLSIVDESVINYELIAQLLLHIHQENGEGAILVFLPGMGEIQKAIEETLKIELFQSADFVILPLHSSLPTSEQTAVFEVPPKGVRKILFSTNIAETSITVEDCVFVVDAGRVKENRRDEVKETPALVECWVSRASAKQRRGRAGRVRPGVAYHLYSSHTYDDILEDYQLPEMLRVGLEDLALQILTLDLGEPSVFLSKALNPPKALALCNSLKLLESLGAVECRWQGGKAPLTDKEEESDDCSKVSVMTELTALGYHIASLPVEARVGKILIYGAMFGCIDPTLTIAAAMTSSKPLFVSPFDQRDAAREAQQLFATAGSDHLTLLNAFNQWKSLRQTKGSRAAQTWTRENFLGGMTLFNMEELRKHYAKLLADIGFLSAEYRVNRNEGDQSANANSGNMSLLKAVLCAGLYPNIIVAPRPLVDGSKTKEAGEFAFRGRIGLGDVHIHPCSVSFTSKHLESRYCCFYQIVKTSKLYVRDITTVSPVSLLLFGGALKIYHSEGVITVDEWLQFRISAKSGVLISHIRLQMEKVLLQKILSPEVEVAESQAGKDLIDSVTVILAREKPASLKSNDDGGDIVRPYVLAESERSGRGRNGGGSDGGRGRRSGRGRGRGGGGRGRGRGRGNPNR